MSSYGSVTTGGIPTITQMRETSGDVKARDTQVMEQMKILKATIEETEKLVHLLETHLNPVMRDPSPAPDGINKDPESIVQLAGDIRGCSYNLARLNSMLDNLINRLEL